MLGLGAECWSSDVAFNPRLCRFDCQRFKQRTAGVQSKPKEGA